MTKKGVRLVISGKPRPELDALAMTHIIIALGREMAARERDGETRAVVSVGVKTP